MKYLAGELVFAYGSNLSLAQMARRCPSWEYVARAELPGHELVFAGYSTRWQGAVATFVEAPRRCVRGIVYSMRKSDLHRLDAFEGVSVGVYDRLRVIVQVSNPGLRARLLPVHTYQLVGFDSPGVPSEAYVRVIARAYREWEFDRRHLTRAVRGSVEAV
jgi:gamma-glutamylcyclotransferase